MRGESAHKALRDTEVPGEMIVVEVGASGLVRRRSDVGWSTWLCSGSRRRPHE